MAGSSRPGKMRSEKYNLTNDGGSLSAVCNCVYGNVARVFYSRTFPSLKTPQTGRLNKSPHTVHAIATRHKASPSSMGIYDRRQLIFCQSRSNFLPAKWSEPR